MNSTQGTPTRGTRPPIGGGRGVTVAAYVALFALGAVQGLIGTFQYSRGPAPLAAIGFDIVILATCVLGSRGMRTALGGVLPAVGWLLVTLVLSSAAAGGSVLVTASLAGEWFLFGGAVAAAAGAVYAFAPLVTAESQTQVGRRPRPGYRVRHGIAASCAPDRLVTGMAGIWLRRERRQARSAFLAAKTGKSLRVRTA